jgi:hypothetical protein
MTNAQIKLLAKFQTDESFRNELLAHVFCAPNPDFILRWNKVGELYLRNAKIPTEQLLTLQSEVKFLRKTALWSILTATLASDAYERMFLKSTSWSDLMYGKMQLLDISIMEGILARIETLKITPPPAVVPKTVK